jgi:choline dehydrogenase
VLSGLKHAVKFVEETESFRQIGGHLMPIPLPGCEMHPFKSHTYFQCLARQLTVTAYKYAGTAPIGRDPSDPNAVVDSHLRYT